MASEDFEVVRDIKGLIVDSRFFDFSFKRVGVDENKRVRRQAQLGNLGVRWRAMVDVAKRCLKVIFFEVWCNLGWLRQVQNDSKRPTRMTCHVPYNRERRFTAYCTFPYTQTFWLGEGIKPRIDLFSNPGLQ